jgi:hypothetical protein
MAQNTEQEGWGTEQQNLNKKLNAEQDTERIAGMAETAWEKAAVGKKTETAKKTTMAQTEKRTVGTQKRMVKTRKTAEGTRKTAAVNKTRSGSLCTRIAITYVKWTAGRFCTIYSRRN